jgi:hypothetical protein
MKAVKLVGLLTLVLALTGCGQKYPQSYGLYIHSGQGWSPIDTSKPCTISEKPEFLVFDARLTQSSEKPDSTITLRPMRWIRWNIDALVAQRNAVPRQYQKTRAGTFLPSESSFKMMYSPVKNHRDMLQVTPATPLANGYFVFDAFGDRVICRKDVSDKPDDLPDQHIVDKWSVTHDEKAGFSWDAFLAASVNQGRAVLNEGFEPPLKLTALLDGLHQELGVLVTAKRTPPMLAFCQRVEHLDSDLYSTAKSQCITVIEDEMKAAKTSKDLPTAIGIGEIAATAGITSDTIISHLAECTRDLTALETAASTSIGELMADMTNEEVRGTLYPLDHYLSMKETSVGVQRSHILYSKRMLAYPEEVERVWMGRITSISKAGGRSVHFEGSANFSDDKFERAEDRNAFVAAANDALLKWKTAWIDRCTVEVTARPYYWSERIFVYDIPYTLEALGGKDKVLREDGKGAFRVKSSSGAPVNLRVRFCPALWPKKKD